MSIHLLPIPAPDTRSDGRITIRPVTTTDAQALYDALDAQVGAWVSFAPNGAQGVEDVHRWIDERARLMADGQVADWVIVDEQTGQVVGWRCLRHKMLGVSTPPDGLLRTSVFVHPDARGQRLAPRSTRLVSAFAFEHGFDRVVAAIEVDNHPSIANAHAAGFDLVSSDDELHQFVMTPASLAAALAL